MIIAFQSKKQAKLRCGLVISDLLFSQQLFAFNNEKINTLLQTKQEEYKTLTKEFDEIQSLLAEALYVLAQNIIRYTHFKLIDADDAIQEAVLTCFEKIERFDPDRGKAFSFLTTVSLNAQKQLWRSTNNFIELKKRIKVILNEQVEKMIHKVSKF